MAALSSPSSSPQRSATAAKCLTSHSPHFLPPCHHSLTSSISSLRAPVLRLNARPITSTFLHSSSRGFVIRASSQVGASGSDPLLEKLSSVKDSFWRFLRPHTIRGTALGSVVNKPYLPIAAGDLSVQSAWFLVLLFAAAGLFIVGCNFGPFISSLFCLGLFLGTIYSVPPFRLKRYPVAAFLIIATVRGFLLNFGVYYATRSALGLTFKWSSPVAFITTFVTVFALVIAITKDLPDVEGDRKALAQYNDTFTHHLSFGVDIPGFFFIVLISFS
ncbi:hypothetical protein J5N97_010991 [Dioscorea zingiberensis]|uniref:Uncharacterized protein n=1 Tax=Dioscorea zingiberensis TaxID=325984 RepID=A0A9D5D066_9LILI|nr:hypothetical protein J5N97_010991 [Dioscorea zingiberensis]